MTDKAKFIQDYGALAQDISDRTGLDPSVVLGQIAHETGWGQHIYGNNVFGISPGGRVAPYASVPAAAQAYVDLINSNRYRNAASAGTPEGQAYAISRSGYGPNQGYGNLLVGAMKAVQAAGFNPSAKPQAPSDDDLVNQGKAIFQQSTGMAIPNPKEMPKSGTVDISSDPQVDAGKELFKQVTGLDPDSSSSSSTPNSASPTENPSSDSSGTPNGSNQVGSKNSPGVMQSLGAGVVEGAHEAADTLSGPFSSAVNAIRNNVPGVDWVDRAVPILGRLDDMMGSTQTYDQNAAARKQAYDQQYGDSVAASIGKEAAPVLMTLPIGGFEGAALRGAPLAARVVGGVASNALQGGAAAYLQGGDVTTGAAVGGALGAAGKAVGALGSATGPISRAMQTKVADKLVQMATGAMAAHLGPTGYEVLSFLIGSQAGPILNDIAARYGVRTAGLVAKMASKVPSAGGSALTGGVASQMQNPLAVVPGQ